MGGIIMKKLWKKSAAVMLALALFLSVFTPSVLAFDDPGWKSGDGETHGYIVNHALTLINRDKGSDIYFKLQPYKDTLLKYCDMPDKDEIWWGNAYHFYNPYTGYNYYPWPTPESVRKKTAMVMFKEHSVDAKELYLKGEYMDAFEKLGRAIHYLEDVNVPHHAANKIAVITNHTQFESYVLENQNKYKASQGTQYALFQGLGWEDYCGKLLHHSALHAYSYVDDATYTDGDDEEDEARWAVAGEATVENAQEAVAAYLYNFLKEVNAID